MFLIVKKTRFFFRLTAAFWKAHKKTIILAFIIGVTLSTLLPKVIKKLLNTGSPERIGIVDKCTIDDLPEAVLEKISFGLTYVNQDGSVIGGLAESWDVKENNQVYLFKLKNNIFWHDQTEIKAQDINFNFSDVFQKSLDNKTIEFRLKEAFSPFPIAVSKPVFKKGLIGNGDYRVKSIKRNGQIIEEIELAPFNKEGKKIYYKFYPTETAAKTAFKLGEINKIENISSVNELKEWPEVEIETKVQTGQLVTILFNNRDQQLGNKSLRQALYYALKKDWPNRAYGPISPDSWAYNDNLKRYDFDLNKASQLIKTAFNNDIPESLEIELTTFPAFFNLAEQISRDWQELNIKTNINVVNVIPDNFQAFLVVEDFPRDPDQYLLWHSTQPSNLSRFDSPQIDILLEEGRKTFDQKKRKEIYLDFQRFLVEDAPAIFLYHPTVYSVSR